ncbi:hypothetical protein M407DRAFT_81165, partial [Tulasnella calospora MUT 4182]
QVFKAYTLSTVSLGMSFAGALKLGHYMKVPPRCSFLVLVVAVFVCTTSEIGVKQLIFEGVNDVCEPEQSARLVCPGSQFGKGSIYYGPLYAAIAGSVLPVFLWWWNRRSPGRTWLGQFNLAYVDNTWCGQEYFLRTRRYRWWSRYNYVLAGALDSGTAIGVIMCFLLLQLPREGTPSLNWWGNTVWQNSSSLLDARILEMN